jgi:2-polyprenyl-3-methyl-5-hydroxy-6-metoxy-1,4-benzoquinol methylase
MVDPAVARHFSRSAAGYTRLRGVGPMHRMRQREQTAVQELATVEAGVRVLDAGCGDGATLDWLRTRGAVPVGIDLTWPMARVCIERGFAVAVQDLENIGLQPVFDWVLCIGALEFVPDPARAIKNLSACLAPNGTLVLLYPRKGPLGVLYAIYHRTHGARIHLFNLEDITELLTGAGLSPPLDRRDCALSSVCTAISSNKVER